MIDTSEILTQADQYAFSLFDPDLIDFDLIECDRDGIISLPLNIDKVPLPEEPFDGDMWFNYELIGQRVETLIIESSCFQRQIFCDSTIYFMGKINHPEYAKYKLSYDNFVYGIKDKLKEQVRSIMTEVKGEFINDNFMEDTYFQVRNHNEKDIYYIINKWWEKLMNGEVNFTDVVNGEGTVYIARNN